MLAAKTCYKWESLQNSAVSSKPITFPGQKKKKEVLFCLLWVFFLVTNSLQTLARSLWVCCLPEVRAASVGTFYHLLTPKVLAVSGPCVPWGVHSDLLGAGEAAAVTVVPSSSNLLCAWV